MNHNEAEQQTPPHDGRIVYGIGMDIPELSSHELLAYNGHPNAGLEFYKQLDGASSTTELRLDLPSDPVVQVAGIVWQIRAQQRREDGALYVPLPTYNHYEDFNAHTLLLSLAGSGFPDGKEYDVSGQMCVRLHSTKNSAKLFNFARTFSAAKTDFLGNFVEINPFVDLKLANRDDGITVDVSFTVEQREIKKPAKEDLVMLKVNENYMEVDKFHLAFHSEYFKSLFFGNRFPGTEHKIALPQSTTMEDFKQLVAILEEKSTLNDDSIAGVFILANFFGFTKLEAKCRKFLIEDCTKNIIFKYQLADACNLTLFRDSISKHMA